MAYVCVCAESEVVSEAPIKGLQLMNPELLAAFQKLNTTRSVDCFNDFVFEVCVAVLSECLVNELLWTLLAGVHQMPTPSRPAVMNGQPNIRHPIVLIGDFVNDHSIEGQSDSFQSQFSHQTCLNVPHRVFHSDEANLLFVIIGRLDPIAFLRAENEEDQAN